MLHELNVNSVNDVGKGSIENSKGQNKMVTGEYT